MTSRHPALMAVGNTHASSVIAAERWSDGESLIDTRAVVPLNDSALPYFPDAVHVALTIEPVLPLPDRSVTDVPDPSLKAYAATRLGFVASVVAVAMFVYGPRLPAPSCAAIM